MEMPTHISSLFFVRDPPAFVHDLSRYVVAFKSSKASIFAVQHPRSSYLNHHFVVACWVATFICLSQEIVHHLRRALDIACDAPGSSGGRSGISAATKNGNDCFSYSPRKGKETGLRMLAVNFCIFPPPTHPPTQPTKQPSNQATKQPTNHPTTQLPPAHPTTQPTNQPSNQVTVVTTFFQTPSVCELHPRFRLSIV